LTSTLRANLLSLTLFITTGDTTGTDLAVIGEAHRLCPNWSKLETLSLILETCVLAKLFRPKVITCIDSFTFVNATAVLASVHTAQSAENLVLSAVRRHCSEVTIRVGGVY
jgi:hypothetical protein